MVTPDPASENVIRPAKRRSQGRSSPAREESGENSTPRRKRAADAHPVPEEVRRRFVQVGRDYFFPDGESYFRKYAKSQDKDFLIAAGLVHGITACGNCPGGPYTNVPTFYWNYVFNWINTRFGT